MQCFSLRGHRDDSTAECFTNRGNFLAILEYASRSDPVIKEYIKKGNKSQKYTSKTIQNEIINIIVLCLREKVLEPLIVVKYYSITVDEVTDQYANMEILCICIRFVDVTNAKPCIKELFLDFLHLQRDTREAVANGILTLLGRYGLNVSNIRGQSYDGASAMAGTHTWTQARIKILNCLTLYTHCCSHVLNLSIASSSTEHGICDMIQVINEVYIFFIHNSPKRQRFLELVLNVYISEPHVKKIKGLCKTRWVERHDCLEIFCNLYGYTFACLEAMTNLTGYSNLHKADAPLDDRCWDTSTRIKAEGLKQSLATSKNIVSLIVLLHGLDSLKGVCIKFQKHDADIVTAQWRIRGGGQLGSAPPPPAK